MDQRPGYRAAPLAALVIEPLDSLTAIFDRRSGQTHLVAPPVPELLAVMGAGADRAWSADAVAAALAVEFALADFGADVVPAIEARLEELVGIGLIERLGVDALAG